MRFPARIILAGFTLLKIEKALGSVRNPRAQPSPARFSAGDALVIRDGGGGGGGALAGVGLHNCERPAPCCLDAPPLSGDRLKELVTFNARPIYICQYQPVQNFFSFLISNSPHLNPLLKGEEESGFIFPLLKGEEESGFIFPLLSGEG